MPTAALTLVLGCGDDGSPSTTTDATTGGTQTMTMTGGSSDPTTSSGPSTAPGTGTTDDPDTTADTTAGQESGSESSTGSVVPCEYPAGAVDPMALNEVLWPYSWPEAIHGDGTQSPLSLEDAPCGLDEVIEWSPHDVLLFISIPAW